MSINAAPLKRYRWNWCFLNVFTSGTNFCFLRWITSAQVKNISYLKPKFKKNSLNYAMINFYWTFYCKFFMVCKIWRSNNKSQFVFMYNGFDRVICYTLCTNWRQLHLTHLTRHMPKHAKKHGNMLIIINSIFNCHHT